MVFAKDCKFAPPSESPEQMAAEAEEMLGYVPDHIYFKSVASQHEANAGVALHHDDRELLKFWSILLDEDSVGLEIVKRIRRI